jgi:AraC-like DNA-binding protein
MTHVQVIPAPKSLQKDVDYFRIVEYLGETALSFKVAPVALPGIVFQHHNGTSALTSIVTPLEASTSLPTFFVYGTGITPSVMNFREGPYTSIQVVFKPHALQSLLGINAATLTNSYTDLHEFSDGTLNDQLIEARTTQEQIRLLTDFLAQQAARANRQDPLVEAGLGLMHAHPAGVRIPHLLQQLHLSERQFERRFRHAVGISPKTYMRVKRFNEVLRHIRNGRYATLGDIAYALNFYDQSHLIRDIQAFSGTTPTALAEDVAAIYHAHTDHLHHPR